MPRLTATVDSEHVRYIEEISGEDGPFDSKSEAVRECISAHMSAEKTIDDLEKRLEAKDARLEDLRRQLREVNRHSEDVNELVEYVETERELQREERERRNAPLWRRARWFVFGRS